MVLREARKECKQPIHEAGEITAFFACELLEIQLHHQDRLVAEHVRTGDCLCSQNLHRFTFEVGAVTRLVAARPGPASQPSATSASCNRRPPAPHSARTPTSAGPPRG